MQQKWNGWPHCEMHPTLALGSQAHTWQVSTHGSSQIAQGSCIRQSFVVHDMLLLCRSVASFAALESNAAPRLHLTFIDKLVARRQPAAAAACCRAYGRASTPAPRLHLTSIDKLVAGPTAELATCRWLRLRSRIDRTLCDTG